MSRIILEIKNLAKSYYSQGKVTQALAGISLDVYAGEVLALLGTNGAGKTTLSSILATVHPPSTGQILYGGRSVYQELPAYRRQVGYCPQRPNLNAYLNLKDNLYFAGSFYGLSSTEIEQSMSELITQLELKAYLNFLPGALSGGWRQRFMLARALIHRPSMLILDEPTVALDPHVRRQLWEKIKALRSQGLSIILTTHYLDEAEVLADRVCILDRGTIKLIDKPANLKSDFKLATLEDVFLKLTEEEVAV